MIVRTVIGLGLMVGMVLGMLQGKVQADQQGKIVLVVDDGGEQDGGDRDLQRGGDRERDRGQARLAPEQGEEGDQDFEEGEPEVQPGQRGMFRLAPNVRWKLGVRGRNTDHGVVVTRVSQRSPASRVGLEQGDVIVTVNGFQIGFVGDELFTLGEELQRRANDDGEVSLLVQNVRNRRLVSIDVRLERSRN